MKIISVFFVVCAIVHFKTCFCGKIDDVLEANQKKTESKGSPCVASLSCVKQSMIFFEALSCNKRPSGSYTQKRLIQFSSKAQFPYGKQVFLENEDACHKELRGKFERGDFDHLYGPYKDLSAVIVEPPPIDESEEGVTQRVIKTLMPGKVFSKEQARECYDLIGSWRACVEAYDIGIPKDYFVACRYLEKLLGKKN